jgi:hypothetical protein
MREPAGDPGFPSAEAAAGGSSTSMDFSPVRERSVAKKRRVIFMGFRKMR